MPAALQPEATLINSSTSTADWSTNHLPLVCVLLLVLLLLLLLTQGKLMRSTLDLRISRLQVRKGNAYNAPVSPASQGVGRVEA